MTKIVLIIFIFTSSNIFSQRVCDSLFGTGFLKISKTFAFNVYNADSTVFLNINESTLESNFDFIKNDKLSKFIKIMCLEERDSCYIVVVNELEYNNKVVLKDSNIQLQTMEDYILESSTICDWNNLKEEINGKPFIPEHSTLFKPIKIEGEWLMVESEYYNYNSKEWHNQYSWVQWKMNNTVIISVMYLR